MTEPIPFKIRFQKIQLELKAGKDLKNNFGKYNYRSCESILEALKPLLLKYDCFLRISDELVREDTRFYVKATVSVVDLHTDASVSVDAYAREEENKKGMDGSQVTGASSSYARKYALSGLLAIDDNKDSDFTNGIAESNAKAQRAAMEANAYPNQQIGQQGVQNAPPVHNTQPSNGASPGRAMPDSFRQQFLGKEPNPQSNPQQAAPAQGFNSGDNEIDNVLHGLLHSGSLGEDYLLTNKQWLLSLPQDRKGLFFRCIPEQFQQRVVELLK